MLGAGGAYTLNTQNNAITTLAGNTGTVLFQDNTGFAIGTVNTAGLTASTAATLTSTGTVTQTQAITTSTLTLTGAGGTFTLNGATNAITNLGATTLGTGALNLLDAGGLTVTGAVGATGGITLNTGGALAVNSTVNAGAGNVTLTATGAISDTAAITANLLTTSSVGGTVLDFGHVVTSFNATNATSGNVVLNDTGGLGITGISNAVGNVTLTNTGAVTQSGAITAAGLELVGAGGIYTLTNPANNIATLAANTGSVSYVDAGALSIGTVNTVGITATGLVDVRTQTGNLTLNNAISTTNNTANAVTLVADVAATPNATGTGGNFINNAGAGAITTGAGGAWRIYTGNPTGTTRGGLVEAGKRYNVDDGSDPLATGNRIYFRIQPTLTVTADAGQGKVYGNADPALTYSTGGTLIDSDANFSPTGSLTRVAGETVAGGPYAISVGTLSSQLGYTLNFAGDTFAISQRPVTVTADAGQNKVYGNADPASYTFTNTSLGTGVALVGSLARNAGENVGSYAITQGGITNAANTNYTITYVGNNFGITPRALTISADNKTKLTTDPLPPFTASYSGFAFADNPASLTGALVFTTPATATSPAGTYIITPSGQASTNYAITYVAGALTVH